MEHPKTRLVEKSWLIDDVLPPESTLCGFMEWLQAEADILPSEYVDKALFSIDVIEYGERVRLVITYQRDETEEEAAERIESERVAAEIKAHGQKIHEGLVRLGIADWRCDNLAKERMLRFLSGVINNDEEQLGPEKGADK